MAGGFRLQEDFSHLQMLLFKALLFNAYSAILYKNVEWAN